MRTPLVLGAGIDRASGVMAADPRGLREATNVYLMAGKAQARRGMTARESYNDDAGRAVSHVLAVQALRQYGELVVVGYQQSTGAVWVYRCAATGAAMARFTAPWFTLEPGSAPPVIVTAAMDDKVFLAHDEPLLGARAPTVCYSSTLSATEPLPPLLYPEVVPEGGTAKNDPIKFRGVAVHLNYLVGFGFGTPEADRPEIVRVSKPASPLEFDADDYWIVGMIGDAVTALASIDNNLVAFKLTQTYQLFGDHARNFGSKPFPTEATYGCIGSRMAVVHNGRCFFWSLSGPRVTEGTGPSLDVGVPLDLLGPAPSALVEAGQARIAYGVHHPNEGVLLFVFGRRGYCLSLVEGEGLRWSYLELGKETFCAGHAFAFAEGTGGGVDPGGGNNGGGPVGGTPAVVPLRLDAALRWRSLGLEIENRYTQSTDAVNVWLRKEGGTWDDLGHWPSTAGQRQTIMLDTLEEGARYTVAVRLRRGATYPATHPDGNPDAWPAWSRVAGQVCAAPGAPTTEWSYDPASNVGRLRATATPSVPGVALEYARRANAGEGFVAVEALAEATHGVTYAYMARHRFRDALGVLTYSPYVPDPAGFDHFAGPREVPVLLTATSPAVGALKVTLDACAAPVVLFYYGPNPTTGQGLSGWFPLGEPDQTMPEGVRPALLAPGATSASFSVPYLAGQAIQVQAFAVAAPATPSTTTPYLYGAGSNTLGVTIQKAGDPPPPEGEEPLVFAGGDAWETNQCTVEDRLSWDTQNFDGALHRLQYRLARLDGSPTSGWNTLSSAASGEIVMDEHTGRIDPIDNGGAGGSHYRVEVRVVDRASGQALSYAEPVTFDYFVKPCAPPPPVETPPSVSISVSAEQTGPCRVVDTASWSAADLKSTKHRIEVAIGGGGWQATEDGLWGDSFMISERVGVMGSEGTLVNLSASVRVLDRTSGAVLDSDTATLSYRIAPCPPPLTLAANLGPRTVGGCGIEDVLNWSTGGFDGAKHRLEYSLGGGWSAGGPAGSVVIDTRDGKIHFVDEGLEGWSRVLYSAAVRILSLATGEVLDSADLTADYWTEPCDSGPPPGTGGGGDDPPVDEPPPGEGGGGGGGPKDNQT